MKNEKGQQERPTKKNLLSIFLLKNTLCGFFFPDPHLHPLFKEKGGVEEISSIIQSSVEAPNEKADNEVSHLV